MIVSKSMAKRLEVQQHDKQPKVPAFPPQAQLTYDLLKVVSSGTGPMSWVASGIMTRLCVLWAPNTPAFDDEKMMAALLVMMDTISAYVVATQAK